MNLCLILVCHINPLIHKHPHIVHPLDMPVGIHNQFCPCFCSSNWSKWINSLLSLLNSFSLSAASFTSWQINCLATGESIILNFQSSTTASGVFLFHFPLSVDTLGPYIFSATITSSSVIRQFLKKLPQIAYKTIKQHNVHLTREYSIQNFPFVVNSMFSNLITIVNCSGSCLERSHGSCRNKSALPPLEHA